MMAPDWAGAGDSDMPDTYVVGNGVKKHLL